MDDLSSNLNTDNLPSTSNLNHSNNITSTSTSIDNIFKFSPEILRLFYIALVIIFILICLTLCVCICLRRRRKSKQQQNKEQLLPEQSNKTSKISTNNPTMINGKQKSLVQPTNSNSKTPINSFYYDTLDDIPFIDESRPTSVVDITQV